MQVQSLPSVSILLPFHREGFWLEEAINSILVQTCSDWELILIANCPDRITLDLAKQLSSRDERILLLREDSPGIAFALNTGLAAARAPLIARMDADDFSLPERIEKQIRYLESHPEVDVLGTRTAPHPEGSPGEGFASFMDWQNSIMDPVDHRLQRFIESPIAHPTVMYRKELVKRYGHYLTTGLPEDYELWLRWMDKGAVFSKLPEGLLLWRDHSGRLTRTHPDYTKEAFGRIRSHYLAIELKRILGSRKLIVCGADRSCRRKASILTGEGVAVAGFADVVPRDISGLMFIPASEIIHDPDLFFLSFVSSRGKAAEMRDFFRKKGMQEGQDFLLAN